MRLASANEIIAIAEFLGNSITDEQTTAIFDHIKQMPPQKQQFIQKMIPRGRLHTRMSIYELESTI